MPRPSLSCLWVLGLVVTGCPAEPPPAFAPPPAPPAPKVSRPDPVQARPPQPPTPEVKRLCAALQTLPRTRRAECCDTTSGFSLQPECERRLQDAIGTHSVRLDPEEVDRCEAAMQKAHAGCDWPGPYWRPVPRECLGIVGGLAREGMACVSNLSCKDGLHCEGFSKTEPGVCKKPAEAGAACASPTDELALVLRQDDVSDRHPVCAAGYCRLGKCVAFSAVGAPCGAKNGCGPEARCIDGVCVAGHLAARGEACNPGGCVDGLRCIGGRCGQAKAPGRRCRADEECFGTCDQGRCVRTCKVSGPHRVVSRP